MTRRCGVPGLTLFHLMPIQRFAKWGWEIITYRYIAEIHQTLGTGCSPIRPAVRKIRSFHDALGAVTSDGVGFDDSNRDVHLIAVSIFTELHERLSLSVGL